MQRTKKPWIVNNIYVWKLNRLITYLKEDLIFKDKLGSLVEGLDKTIESNIVRIDAIAASPDMYYWRMKHFGKNSSYCGMSVVLFDKPRMRYLNIKHNRSLTS